jgi:hypothetical protein
MERKLWSTTPILPAVARRICRRRTAPVGRFVELHQRRASELGASLLRAHAYVTSGFSRKETIADPLHMDRASTFRKWHENGRLGRVITGRPVHPRKLATQPSDAL